MIFAVPPIEGFAWLFRSDRRAPVLFVVIIQFGLLNEWYIHFFQSKKDGCFRCFPSAVTRLTGLVLRLVLFGHPKGWPGLPI